MKKDTDIFQELAQDTINRIEEPWEKIKMEIGYIPEGTTQCAVWIINKGINKPVMVMHKAQQFEEWLQDLKVFTEANSFVSWNRITLLVEESGKFSSKFSWDEKLAKDIQDAHLRND